jgi:acetylornithine deacetylase/succinyl-diaminopimelate desuccinylase-like protein
MPVHIALSYDEEVGCLGVRSLLKLEQRPIKPMLCIIGEPTELKPVLGHKGKLAMRCDVHGQACHSAYAPLGVNAIEYAAELIGELGRIGQRCARASRRALRSAVQHRADRRDQRRQGAEHRPRRLPLRFRDPRPALAGSERWRSS